MLFQPSRPPRREKLFGEGRPKPMSRHQKVNLMREARRLRHERSTEPGKHITRADVDVFSALLWGFHNAKSGLCFPSYEAIAKAAGCARSTVYEAISRLEAAGLLTWVHRLKRVYERVTDLFGAGVHGQRSKVQRTSNGYRFAVPPDVESSKSETKPGTVGQELIPLSAPPPPPNPERDRAEQSRLWLAEYRKSVRR
jgi:Helix-turn-helix domain